MFTILGTDGKEYGPVAVAKIQEWMIAGRANLQTQARRATETEWKTLGDFPEFTGAGSGPSTAGVPPAAPAFPAASPVAQFTPVIPVTPAAPKGTAAEIAADLIARSSATAFDPFSCIARSFDLWKNNFLPLVGVTALIGIIQFVVGLIPFVSLVNMFFFGGVFAGGLHYYYLGKMRGQPRELGDAFAGFSQAFGRLAIANLLTIGLFIAICIPFLVPFGATIYQLSSIDPSHLKEFPPLPAALILTSCLMLIPLLYISIAWAFTYTLVIDQGLGPWTALEVSRRVITRKWFHMLLLMICSGILVLFGLFGFIIGILFTLPLGVGSILYAYEDLCRPPPAN
jgi:hypothetical protein